MEARDELSPAALLQAVQSETGQQLKMGEKEMHGEVCALEFQAFHPDLRAPALWDAYNVPLDTGHASPPSKR